MIPSVLDTREPTVRSADGTLIWAAAAGRSPSEATTLVLVPGFSCSSIFFSRQFSDDTLLSKYALITYEPRGQGRSGQPLEAAAYASERNAEDFKAVCEAFGATRVVYAGWSYGGLIPADVFAHLGPDWISGVVYLDAIPWRSMHLEIASASVMGIVGALLAAGPDTFGARILDFVNSCLHTPNLADVPYGVYAAAVAAVATQDPGARHLLLTARDQDPSALQARAPDLPVLLVMGEHDGHMIWQKLDAFIKKHFARSEFVLVKDAGHAPFWERPDEVNKVLAAFLDKV